MWQYNHTENLLTGNNQNIQHSDESYCGNYHNSNELYHWKYIYKKKINGKWRYYYDDPSEKAYKNAQSAETKAQLNYALAKSRSNEAVEEGKELSEYKRKWAGKTSLTQEESAEKYRDYESAKKKAENEILDRSVAESKAKREYDKARIQLKKAKKTYAATTLSRASAKIIVAGANLISNLFSPKKKKKKKKKKK